MWMFPLKGNLRKSCQIKTKVLMTCAQLNNDMQG